MRIAIVGTHGSGKTTIAHELVAALKRQDVTAYLCREAARESHYVSSGTFAPERQMDIFARHIVAEMEAVRTNQVVICDRSLLDVLIYTRLWFSDVPEAAPYLLAMEAFVTPYLTTYDLILRTTSLFDPRKTVDPARPKSKSLQVDMHDCLRVEMDRRSIPFVDLPAEGAAIAAEREVMRLLKSWTETGMDRPPKSGITVSQIAPAEN